MDNGRPIGRIVRLLLRLLGLVLQPVASIRPGGSWARLIRRLRALGDREASAPMRRDDRPSPVPLATFCVLIALAAIVWIWDIVRDPPPEPAHRTADTAR